MLILVVAAAASLGLVGVNVYSTRVTATPRDTTLNMGSPTSMLVSESNALPSSPVRSLAVTMPDQRISTIIGDLGHLPYLGEQVISSCPSDDGSAFEITFGYSHGTSRTIAVRKTGCRDVFLDGKWSRRAPEAWSALIPDLEDMLVTNTAS